MLVTSLIFSGLVGAIVAYFMTGVARRLAVRVGALDHPEDRKVHDRPVPSLGGLAIFAGFAAAIGAQLAYQWLAGPTALLPLVLTPETWGILAGGLVILLVGVADDVFELSVAFKFSGQIIAAGVLVVTGTQMEFIGNPLGGLVYLGSFGAVLTVVWVVGFINVVNFIDGLDGLAAGVAAISAAAFALFAFQTGQTGMAVLSAAVAGGCLGFLRHNFNPASIFMGDSGSMFLGFVLGAITVSGVMKSIAAIALLAPLVIMGVPIFDAALAILRRYRQRQPVTQADRDHLHHRLLRRGFTQRQTVTLIYVWSITLSVIGFTMKLMPALQKYLVIVALLFMSFLFAEFVGFFDNYRDESRRWGRSKGGV